MDVQGTLGSVLTVVAIVLALGAIYAVVVLVKSLRSVTESVTDLHTRLVPLLEKADITVDAVNAELLRIDAIVSQAEEVGDVVSTASGIIKSPVNKAAEGIAKLVRAFGRH